jgi:hypothetical protein
MVRSARSARFSLSAGACPRVAALPFAAAALCAGLSAPAQAQTAYSLTVLKPASTMAQADVSRSTSWVIDNSNRVVNDVAWVAGYGYSIVTFKFQFRFENLVSRWPASTASSVGPAKLYPLPTNFFQALSPKGQIVLIENKVYDTVSKVTSPLNPAPTGNGTVWAYAVNDAGVVASTQFNYSSASQPLAPTRLPLTWVAGTGLSALPLGNAGGGDALAINARGDVAGDVLDAVNSRPTAAWWSNGQLNTVQNPSSDASSRALAIDNSGRMLLSRGLWTCVYPANLPPACREVTESLALRELNGAETTLVVNGVKLTFDVHMNGAGLVYGNLHDNTNAVTQAFVWVNGQAQDLNAYVAARGAKLPNGATLKQVHSINDQGSVVATLLAADKKTVSIVRLTAR